MSSDAAPTPYMSYADFVVFEEKSETKHEWLDGVVYELGTRKPIDPNLINHSGIKVAITCAIGNSLRGKRCQIFGSDLAIRIPTTDLDVYPDASVVCGSLQKDPNNRNAVTNPRVIVEVLSDSTEAYDRGEKFAHYKRIPSLAEYVLVSQHERRIEVFRQTSPENWELVQTALTGQTAQLASIECALSVDEVYADPLAEADG